MVNSKRQQRSKKVASSSKVPPPRGGHLLGAGHADSRNADATRIDQSVHCVPNMEIIVVTISDLCG